MEQRLSHDSRERAYIELGFVSQIFARPRNENYRYLMRNIGHCGPGILLVPMQEGPAAFSIFDAAQKRRRDAGAAKQRFHDLQADSSNPGDLARNMTRFST
jgi:hypothetical protein